MQLFSFSRRLAETSHIPRKRTRQWCQVSKLHVRKNFKRRTGRTRKAFYVSSRKEHFEEKFWHKPKFFDFWAMSEKLPVSCWSVFKGVVNTAFHMSREKLWDKSVFSKKNKFDIFFWFRMKKFRICGRSFQQGCQKQNSRDQSKFLVKLYLEEYTTLNLLMVFVRKICFARKLQLRQ